MRRFGAFWHGPESEDGQAIVLIAITMLGMLMMVGLAIDAGQLYSARRAMQEAADAAAYAASVTLYQGGTQAQSFTAAADDATRNGFTHDGTTVWVTIQQPTTAPYNTDRFVEVTIKQNVRTSLVPAQSAITEVTVHAISGAESLNNAYALMALDRNATNDAFLSGPTATITLSGGGILVNSTGATAANSTTPAGSWTISCPSTAPCAIDVAGGSGGSWPVASPGSPNYFEGLRTGQPQVSDPFAGYPKPSTSGLLTDRAGFGPSNQTLGTGIYTTTLTNANLCHGVYILKGGGMGGSIGVDTTSTDPVTLEACDGRVFIFNTLSSYPASGGTCTGMTVTGNQDVTLYAMTSGTYKGLLFYQDAACTAAMSFGGASFQLTTTGTIYLPG
ncbi:MAG: pilus assembly protein TadG-related protein, partial [Actinomycetota bacterium]